MEQASTAQRARARIVGVTTTVDDTTTRAVPSFVDEAIPGRHTHSCAGQEALSAKLGAAARDKKCNVPTKTANIF
jgi:hypothetical protein